MLPTNIITSQLEHCQLRSVVRTWFVPVVLLKRTHRCKECGRSICHLRWGCFQVKRTACQNWSSLLSKNADVIFIISVADGRSNNIRHGLQSSLAVILCKLWLFSSSMNSRELFLDQSSGLLSLGAFNSEPNLILSLLPVSTV